MLVQRADCKRHAGRAVTLILNPALEESLDGCHLRKFWQIERPGSPEFLGMNFHGKLRTSSGLFPRPSLLKCQCGVVCILIHASHDLMQPPPSNRLLLLSIFLLT